MDMRQNVHLAHFQLRNVLASTARNRSYYPGRDAVIRINPISGRTEKVMDTSVLSGGPIISTLAANHGLLVAGSFHGDYCIKNLDSESGEQYDGPLSERGSITTHVQVNLARTSSSPIAAFACNDSQLRLMDIATQKFVLEKTYDDPINCAVLSPDRRLRAMVGDNTKVLITEAETGKTLHVLEGHRDFGFACDWADDGYTVATGCQDMSIKIWDARRWNNSNGDSVPVCTLRTEMSGIRSMRFSPVGSGRKVLVAAEESDIVNIIDARDFSRKQTLDIFGEIGGVAFANEGQNLQVLCCDRDRGGLIQLERWDLAPQPHEFPEQGNLTSANRTCGLRNDDRELPSRLGVDWRDAPHGDEYLRKPKIRYGASFRDTMAPF
jgi:WD40 repeat protein